MTTKKAIELIKKYIKNYKKAIVIMEEFSTDSGKIWSPDSSPYDDIMPIIGTMIQDMATIIISSYKNQIEHYQNILTHLEPKKNKSKKT